MLLCALSWTAGWAQDTDTVVPTTVQTADPESIAAPESPSESQTDPEADPQAAPEADRQTEPRVLQLSPTLNETEAPGVIDNMPVFLFGGEIRSQENGSTSVKGQAEFRRTGLVIKADAIDYHEAADWLQAPGLVRLNNRGSVFQGHDLQLHPKTMQGQLQQVNFTVLKTNGSGRAQRLDFLGPGRLLVHSASYTTCTPDNSPDWKPDWEIKAKTMTLDQTADEVHAEDAVLRFKDVPLLAFPSFSFPLSDKRRSGFLSPTLDFDNISGVVFALPYYWNMAPNRDMTLVPSNMSRRGANLGYEFRFLETQYQGMVRGDYMPADRLRLNDEGTAALTRWSYVANLNGLLSDPAIKSSSWSGGLRLNRVSDNNYWQDFPRSMGSATQRLLPSDASLLWQNDAVSLSMQVRRWQTLQDLNAPIVPPYDKLPEIILRLPRWAGAGWEGGFEGQYAQFSSDPSLTGQRNGHRSVGIAHVQKTWGSSAWSISPQLKWHLTHYSLDGPVANNESSFDRSVPTFSLDNEMVFERPFSWGSQSLRQTLEPRALFVYTPYVDQGFLPNYDSAAKDFNLSSLFSDNPYVGQDRIADAKLLTFGVTSRYLMADSATEVLRWSLAQRYRFANQAVTMPGEVPIQERFSDILAGASWRWNSQFSMEQALQYNPQESLERSTTRLKYHPGPFKAVNFSYLYQRYTSSQADLSWQWPLGGASGGERQAWYSTGRLNYSLLDNQLINGLLGFEYASCCWIGRFALERIQTSASFATIRLLLQLELLGFSQVGYGALNTFRNHIANYQSLYEASANPSRFGAYD